MHKCKLQNCHFWVNDPFKNLCFTSSTLHTWGTQQLIQSNKLSGMIEEIDFYIFRRIKDLEWSELALVMLVIAIAIINFYIKCLYSQNNAEHKCAISSEKEPISCWGINKRGKNSCQIRLQTAVKNAEREVIQAEAGRRTLTLALCQYRGPLKSLKIKGKMKNQAYITLNHNEHSNGIN